MAISGHQIKSKHFTENTRQSARQTRAFILGNLDHSKGTFSNRRINAPLAFQLILAWPRALRIVLVENN